ncbi:CCCH like finger domain nucleoporin [Cryptosporidium sp. chipmunk genotype I]|uniref:CCCH like finger domain nucleoporin n=1 Tax=Cryptosporidium sp. chipmunk genotype I TaxID=1280935 RepID=UPI003519E34A|nr:CCCH like finger domain nucleoporin [Cryptosporidium sp. chipmunk genotype I]
MSNRRPCQFYLRGSCRFGNNCRDYHPNGSIFEQGMANSSGNVLGGTSTSGFGMGRGQFNPFSGSVGNSSGDMSGRFASGGGTGAGPFGNYGGPFGGGSGTLGGNNSFGGGMTSTPFGGGTVSTAGSAFGSSPFGGGSGSTTGSVFGSSPFGGGTSATGSVFGSSSFGIGHGSAIGSSPFGSAISGSGSVSTSSGSGKPTKSDNPVLQTLELIGMVVNSGVWPFGRIGLLNQSQDSLNSQSQAFPSLDLSIEEYRWKFYQSDPSNWNNLHLETLKLLAQLYNSFIEQGKMQSKLPTTHQLYNLDFSLYSKIGNWYLPNLGKDFVNKSNNANTNCTTGSMENPFGGKTQGFGQGAALGGNSPITSPFGVIGGGTNTSFVASSATSSSVISNNVSSPFGGGGGGTVNSLFGFTSPSQPQLSSSFGGADNNQTNVNQPSPIGNNSIGLLGSQGTGLNVSNSFNIFGNATNQHQSLDSGGAYTKYSYSNPDVNDDNHSFNRQNLHDWELDAFKDSTFEENKIPEKIPPKYLRMYS